MTIDKMLNLLPQALVKKKKTTAKSRAKTKNKLRSKRKSVKMEGLGRYGVVTALIQALSGLTLGQIWEGDAVGAKKELDRIFGKAKLKLGMVEEEEVVPICRDEEEKCFAVTLLKVHGVDVYALLDSGAARNVASPRLVKLLALKPEK